MSKTASVLNYLLKGKTVTPAELSTKFRLGNPYEVIRQLRMKGYAIYTNKATLWNGNQTVKYKLEQPSKEMVAAAYASRGFKCFK